MEPTSTQLRRLDAIRAQLSPHAAGPVTLLQANPTAGEFVRAEGYSAVLPEILRTDKWNVYRSAKSPLKLVRTFAGHPEIETLHDNFVYAANTYPDHKYLGTRIREDGTVGEYKWMTYGEASIARYAVGSGLVHNQIGKGACIGLYMINRPEWIIVDHACSAYSYISVPLYDTLGPDAVSYIVNHSEIQAIFCLPQTLTNLLSSLPKMPSVRLIVVVGGVDGKPLPDHQTASGVRVISYSDLHFQGKNNLHPSCPPKASDIATICYTSGTTGMPKGAILSHENLIANVAGSAFSVKFDPTDVYISYLPLAHIFERSNQISLAHNGVAVGFYQGDNLKLMDDMISLRPTVFVSVPRLFNRIYAGIMNAVKTSGPLKERLFHVAYDAKLKALKEGRTPSPIWDRLVFNKIKSKLGGRVRFICSGASPLSADVLDFMRVCFCDYVIEGYGMTESSCSISVMERGDQLTGHVGPPNPACEVKLADVPEMNYTCEDKPHPRGEICVRGPVIFKGYYKDEVQTNEVIDEDGWLHTGDIGLWLPGGRLKIIDRKKNIFKLAQGEYVAPEKIENVYVKCKFIAQCFVYGDSFNSCLVGIISVEHQALKDWAISQGIKFADIRQLCDDPRAKAVVLAEMNALGGEAKLRGFEFVKSITLIDEPFTLENGLLTPTFKIKRPQAKQQFAKAISAMYAELSKFEEKTL